MWRAIASLPGKIADRFWKQSSTFRRLIFSHHVMDLQVIFLAAFAMIVVMLEWQLPAQIKPDSIATVLIACGAILGWSYQSGSKRLGIVDLFASEIASLCRVAAIMEVVPRLIRAHERLSGHAAADTPGAPQQEFKFARFTSEEDYFPVFERNTTDLQVLEADVVINVTAFYTYMKAFRDQLRALSELGPGDDAKPQKLAALVNAIYMLFLGFESARKSVNELTEYEPAQAEALVAGLISELPAYRFLTKCFGRNDFRARRLGLREKQYDKVVPDLYDLIMRGEGPDWETAKISATDLARLYNDLGFTPRIDLGDDAGALDMAA